MIQNLSSRTEIEQRFKWNAESVFTTETDWEAEAAAVHAAVNDIRRYQGRLAEGAPIVAEALAAVQDLVRRVYVLSAYAGMAYAVDTTNTEAAKRNSRANGLQGLSAAAAAFVEPELLGIGEETLRR